MAFKTRAELKAYLETGDRPTEEQLAELLDAMVLKSELGAGGDLDPYPAGDGGAITNLNLPDPLPALDGSNLTGISLAEYNDLAETPSYATSTTFALSGDQTGYFDVNRRIRVLQDTGYITHVKSRSYSAGSDATTVETTDPLTSVNLVTVGVSAFRPAAVGGGMTAPMIGWPFYAQTGGTATAYTLSLSQLSVVDGALFVALIHTGNTGAATLNVNSGGAKSIKINGADPAPGALVANRLALFSYNPSLDVYEAFVIPVSNPGKNELAAKTANYTIDLADLAAPMIVPIDISSAAVDVNELALSSMSGWAIYSIVADSGLSSSRKAQLKDSGGTVIWEGKKKGDYIMVAYNGSTRRILAQKATPMFSVWLGSDQSHSTPNVWEKLVHSSKVFDVGSNFSTGTFTAPIAGTYLFMAGALITDLTDGQQADQSIYVNSSLNKLIHMTDSPKDSNGMHGSGAVLLNLDAGDTVEHWGNNGGTKDWQGDDETQTWFMGILIA